jgi:nucleotide-binding universal stress UspA family protein
MTPIIRHVLAATDFGPASEHAIAYAAGIAGAAGARLHIVHVLERPFTTSGPYQFHLADTPARQEHWYQCALAELRRVAADIDGIETSVEVRQGAPAETLVKAAVDYGADLVVLGAYDHGILAHLMGNGLDQRLRRAAPCPVLSVREQYTAPALFAEPALGA